MPVQSCDTDLQVERVQQDGVHVVKLRGEVDIANADRLRRTLVESPLTEVLVDVSGLNFIEARGLAALVAAHRHWVARGLRMRVRGATPLLRRMLDLTRLTFLLDEAV